MSIRDSCAKVLPPKGNPTNHHPLSLSDHKSLEMKLLFLGFVVQHLTFTLTLFAVGLSCEA